MILPAWMTENNIYTLKDVKQGTAVYRTVRTVVWEVETGTNPVSPTRFKY
ncbi:MAG: hypothetical protein LBN93_02195 [Candidatus Symbiothrix sp.]|nr:hypothetical protein [Candidatus Symbiothrix sp.]